MPLPREIYYTLEDYYNTPENVHVELIDGQLFNMAAPDRIHQELLGELYFSISGYIKSKNGTCKVYPAPFAVQLKADEATVVEPDISVICDAKKLNKQGCLGAPDWVIEIVSPSNSRHDYITKLNLYNSAGVREYWIVDPQTRSVYVYDLADENLVVRVHTFDDTVKAGIYEDLFINFSVLTP